MVKKNKNSLISKPAKSNTYLASDVGFLCIICKKEIHEFHEYVQYVYDHTLVQLHPIY